MRRLRPDTEPGKKPGAFMGFAGLAHVLAMTKAPTSPHDVSATIGLGIKRASGILRQFWLMGLVHRVGWIKPTNGFPTPIYQIGEGEDVPAMIGRTGTPHAYADMRPKLMEPRVVAFASVIQALNGPISVADLAHQSGVGDSRLRELLAVLNLPHIALAHIAGHEPRSGAGGSPSALWTSGEGKNAKPPKPKPRTRKNRQARTEMLAKGGWINTVLELRRGAGIKRPTVRCSVVEVTA